jgi:uncharacterized membrane protein YeaQ/YmgE (transglycosylase-associated protein family)
MHARGRRRLLRGGVALAGMGLLSGCGIGPPWAPSTKWLPRVGFLKQPPLLDYLDAFRAGMVMGGRGFGVLGNIVVGIIGSIIGGFLASLLLGLDFGGFNPISIAVAFVGAIVLLLILRAIPGRQPFER